MDYMRAYFLRLVKMHDLIGWMAAAKNTYSITQ